MSELDDETAKLLLKAAQVCRDTGHRPVKTVSVPEDDTEASFGEIASVDGGDVNNGRAFAERFNGHLCYVTASREWRAFNGVYWELASQVALDRHAKHVLRQIIAKCAAAVTANPRDLDTKEALDRAHSAYRNIHKVRALIDAASSERGMYVPDPSYFDANPWLLGVRNGAVNLRTGKLLEPSPELLISKVAPVDYSEDAECPIWLETLNGIFQGSAELIGLFQRICGYTLSGDASEEVFFFLFGDGANGKSTLTGILQALLADYVGALPSRVVTDGKNNETEARLAKAQAVGKRLLWVNETAEGDVWDDDILKVFSSRDEISGARFHHANPFSFTPTHKLWVRGNHRPGLRDNSHAMWRRIIIIPFRAKFEGAAIKRNLDRQIIETEAAGVLRWMVEGCLQWQRDGRLIVPEIVEAEKRAYKSETDLLQMWIDFHCKIEQGAEAPQTQLYDSYVEYMNAQRLRPVSSIKFGKGLEAKGFKRHDAARGKIVEGLHLKNTMLMSADED